MNKVKSKKKSQNSSESSRSVSRSRSRSSSKENMGKHVSKKKDEVTLVMNDINKLAKEKCMECGRLPSNAYSEICSNCGKTSCYSHRIKFCTNCKKKSLKKPSK